MSIDFNKWTRDFGGEAAVKEVEKAKEKASEYTELPEGTYVCKLEKLELAESKNGKPMVKGQFRIVEGQHKKQCVFYNAVLVANDPSKNGFMMHKALEFLRSLKVFDESEIDFDGNFEDFNDLLLDLVETAESDKLKFEVEVSKDGEYSRVKVLNTFE